VGDIGKKFLVMRADTAPTPTPQTPHSSHVYYNVAYVFFHAFGMCRFDKGWKWLTIRFVHLFVFSLREIPRKRGYDEK
jgi:hypothetical protein